MFEYVFQVSSAQTAIAIQTADMRHLILINFFFFSKKAYNW